MGTFLGVVLCSHILLGQLCPRDRINNTWIMFTVVQGGSPKWTSKLYVLRTKYYSMIIISTWYLVVADVACSMTTLCHIHSIFHTSSTPPFPCIRQLRQHLCHDLSIPHKPMTLAFANSKLHFLHIPCNSPHIFERHSRILSTVMYHYRSSDVGIAKTDGVFALKADKKTD